TRPDVPRQVFAQDLLYSFGSFLTICEVTRNRAVDRTLAIAKTGHDPGPVVAIASAKAVEAETISDEVAATQNLDTLTRDQIRAHVATYFAGHGFTRLIAALLEAEGYRASVSLEGPDNGVD